MSYLNDEAIWEAGVRQLEETDNCEAGVFNEPFGQLTHRTSAVKQMIEIEAATRRANEQVIGARLNAVEGRGGPLQAHDFESETPSQEAVTQYACEAIWGKGGTFTWNEANPSASTYETDEAVHTAGEIFNSTWVRNTYDGINHRVVLVNTPDTNPAVFLWEDVGYDTVGIATSTLAGLVKSGGDVEIDPVTGLMSVKGGAGVSFSPDGWGLVTDGRNLLDVLGVGTIAEAVELLHQKINADGVPDFRGLQIGDYLDLPSLNDGSTNLVWNESYKNLRIVISGFNTYKHMGSTENTKNHIVFTFENCPVTKAMNSSNTNAGGYASSDVMKPYLEGGFLTGLIAALGHDYMYPVQRLISNKGGNTWLTAKIFLLTEIEVFGVQCYGDELGQYSSPVANTPIQLPIFRDSFKHRIKRYNGSRQWWFLGTSCSAGSSSFCVVATVGSASTDSAGSAGGCAPAFCVR
jgi:hypothetical protein